MVYSWKSSPGKDPLQGLFSKGGVMANLLKKKFLFWDPITNPVVQNTILGFVIGIMVGINLRVLYLRVKGPAIVWILFFVFGIAIGFFSGIERKRHEEKKRKKIFEQRFPSS
jgi:hypothetical protein